MTFRTTTRVRTSPAAHGQDASRGAGQDGGQRDQDEPLERDPQERAQREILRLVGSDEGGPHEQRGEDREHDGDASHARAADPAGGGTGRRRRAQWRTPWRPGRGGHRRRACVPCRLRHSHHTSRPNDSASRARATTSGGLVERRRQHVRGRDGQHDPLRRRHHLAPVARRQRRAHPRQQPPGGEERVAGRADREHPRAGRAGDVHAEDEDQERVDLAVEARAEPRSSACAAPPIRRPRRARARRRPATPAATPARAGRTSPQPAPPRRRRACRATQGDPVGGGQTIRCVRGRSRTRTGTL